MIKKKFHFVTQNVVVVQRIRKVEEMTFEQLANDGNFPAQDDDVFDDTYDSDTIPITIKVATQEQFQVVKKAISDNALGALLNINTHHSYTQGLLEKCTFTDPVFSSIKVNDETLTVTLELSWSVTSDN